MARASGRKSTSQYASKKQTEAAENSDNAAGSSSQDPGPGITDMIRKKVDQLIAEALASTPGLNFADQSNSGKQGRDQSNTSTRNVAKNRTRVAQEAEEDTGDSTEETGPVEAEKRGRKRGRSETRETSKRQKKKLQSDRQSSGEDSSQHGKSGTGECTSSDEGESEVEDQPSRQSFGLLVGETIPLKLKTKIKLSKFVEMADLLPQNYSKGENLVLKATEKRGVQFVKQSGPRFVSIEQWNQAFVVYMSVYMETAKSAQEAIALSKQMLTYYRDINTLAKQNLQWYSYDRQFRLDRSVQQRPTLFSTIRHDLMLDAAVVRKSRPVVSNFRNGSFRSQTKYSDYGRNKPGSRYQSQQGMCFAFNAKERHCPRGDACRFKHECSWCSGPHPSYRCDKNSSTGPTQQHSKQFAPRPQTNPNQPRPATAAGGGPRTTTN